MDSMESRTRDQDLALILAIGQLARACWERFRPDLPEDLDLSAEAALVELIGLVFTHTAQDLRSEGAPAFDDEFVSLLREDPHTRWADRLDARARTKLRRSSHQAGIRLQFAQFRAERDPIQVRANAALAFIRRGEEEVDIEELSALIENRLTRMGETETVRRAAQTTRRWPWP